MFVLDESAGIIEVDIIVRVATGKTRNVVEATHCDNAADPFGVAKGEICSMVSAEACASGNQKGIRVPMCSERENLVKKIAIILDMSPCTFTWMTSPGIPAFAIDAIYRKHLNPTLVQMIAKLSHHPSVFPLKETAL